MKSKPSVYIKDFTEEEFSCGCGCGSNDMDDSLLIRLQSGRTLAGIPFIISSGYRCEEHNKEVGGKWDSSHLSGFAVDIAYPNSYDMLVILRAVLDIGFQRVGIGKDFIHVDNDPFKPGDIMWTYYE